MPEKLNLSEAAIEILKATSDGDDLIPRHLQLLENAVNGFLDEKGVLEFNQLLGTVRAGYFKTRSKTIAVLNDELRTTFDASKGRVVMTRGVQALGEKDIAKILNLVSTFNTFSQYNDPFGEHDCSSVDHNGEKVIWKIDYYNKLMEYGSEDPADPLLTTRVLTIMLAHEY